jgi:hypothetical protein
MVLIAGSEGQRHPSEMGRGDVDGHQVDLVQGAACSRPGSASFNADGCAALFEESAIGLWAAEAATRYGVKEVDALEMLAFALVLDGGM